MGFLFSRHWFSTFTNVDTLHIERLYWIYWFTKNAEMTVQCTCVV